MQTPEKLLSMQQSISKNRSDERWKSIKGLVADDLFVRNVKQDGLNLPEK